MEDSKTNLISGSEKSDRKDTLVSSALKNRFKNMIEAPGNLKKAKDYNIATMIYNVEKINLEKCQFDDISLNPIPDQPDEARYPICFNNKSVSQLGIGVSLYFEYIKFTCFIFLLGCLSGAGTTLFFNYYEFSHVHDYCELSTKAIEVKDLCKSFKKLYKESGSLLKFSFRNDHYYNKIAELLSIDVINIDLKFYHFFNVVMILVITFAFYFMFANYSAELDLQNETIEDYTAFVTNIPRNANKPDIIKTFEDSGIKPVDYLYCFILENYYEIKNNIQNYEDMIKYCNSKNLTFYKPLCGAPIELTKLHKLLTEEEEKLAKLEKEFEENPEDIDDNIFTGAVFAYFKTEEDANNFKAKTKKSGLAIFLKYITGQDTDISLDNYHIRNANEPSDIIWENLGYSYGAKLKRTLLMNLMSLCLICISFFILYGVTKVQKDITDEFTKSIASLGFSILVNAINFVISKVLMFAANYEKPASFSQYYFSLSLKLTIFTFINTALNPLVSFRVSEMSDSDSKVLDSNLFAIFLVNMVYPVYWFIDPFYFITLFLRYRAEKHFEQVASNKTNDPEINKTSEPEALSTKYTQKSLNQIYLNPDFELFLKYSYIGKTLLMTLFLMPYYPLAPIMSGIGMVLLYAIEKYKFAKKYRKPEQLSSEISTYYISITRLGVALYYIMVFVLDEVSDDENKGGKIACLVISLFLCAIPFEAFKDNYICFDDVSATYNIEDKFFTFGMNYEMINPVTKVQGTARYLDNMIKAKLLSETEKEKFLNGEMGEEVSNVIELYYNRVNKKKAASKLVGNKSGKGGLAFLAAGGLKKKPSMAMKE